MIVLGAEAQVKPGKMKDFLKVAEMVAVPSRREGGKLRPGLKK